MSSAGWFRKYGWLSYYVLIPLIILFFAGLLIMVITSNTLHNRGAINVYVKSATVQPNGVLTVTYFVDNPLNTPLDGYLVQAFVPCFSSYLATNVAVIPPHSKGRTFYFELQPVGQINSSLYHCDDGFLSVLSSDGSVVLAQDYIKVSR